MPFRLFVILSLLVLANLCAQAQSGSTEMQYVHRSWTAEDGLNSNSATAITRTQDGYMWVGTTEGLIRFDGVHFTVFEAATTEGLEGNRIRALLADRQNNLWVGTEYGGLSRYRDGRFIDHKAEVPSRWIGTLYEDDQGRIWIGTSEGMYRFDGTHFSFYEPGNQLPAESVYAFLQDHKGVLWAGTNQGLVYLDGDRFVSFQDIDLSYPIWSVVEDQEGVFWIGGERGVERLTGTNLTMYLPGTVRHNLVVDQTGRLWAGAVGRGLHYFDGTRFVLKCLGAQCNPFVNALFADTDGLLWVGTADHGLHQLQVGLFTAYDRHIGLEGRGLGFVQEDKDGTIWVVSTDKGPIRLDPGTRTASIFSDDRAHRNINRIMASVDGTLWGKAGARVVRFENDRFVSIPAQADLGLDEDAGIFAMAPGRHDGIWIGFRSGHLVHVQGDRYERVVAMPGLQTQDVQLLFEDRQGRLWLGQGIGRLCRQDADQLTCYDQAAGLPAYFIRALFDNADGSLWIGTYGGGLCRLADEQVRCLNQSHGLPGNTVHDILEDDFGFIWMGSNSGVIRISRQVIEDFFEGKIERIQPDVYGAADGMPSSECNWGAREARDGRFWFPTSGGLTVVDPAAAMQHTRREAMALIEQVVIDGQPRKKQPYLRIPAGSDRVEFHYTGVYYQAPEKLRFRYRLVGHDAHWIEAGENRTAAYTNLSPGAYTFQVQATLGSAGWSPQAIMAFDLNPHFYQAWWFRLLGLALIGFGLVGAYQYRVRRLLERERLHQSEAEAQRLVELDAAKSQFFTNISHEFRTPLTLIISPVQDALERETLTPAAQTRNRQILRSANRLLGLIDRLLDLSKLEAGKLNLNPEPGELIECVQKLVLGFAPLAERNRINLQFRTQQESLYVWFDHEKVSTVLSNLISNALKFTPEGGKVWVTLGLQAQSDSDGPADDKRRMLQVNMTVKDTGPGIPRDVLPRIFNRFEQAEGAETRSHQSGTGIGLALAKELVELHGGALFVESEPGFGSSFIIRLPLEVAESSTDEGVQLSGLQGDGLEYALAEAPVIEGPAQVSDPLPDAPLILLVDDNPKVRALLHARLGSHYRIMEAENGAEGLDLVRKHQPDLILCDVMMPVLDGFELCKSVRSDEKLHHIPIILLTAKAGDEDTVTGLNTGADDYVAKPFHMRTLTAKIANLITSRRQLQAEFGRRLIVGEGTLTVTSDDERFVEHIVAIIQVHLGDPEFGVAVLAEEAGLSRRQLARRVKSVLGETPSELIRRLRLEYAATLLEAHAGTVSEIAYRVGFKSPSHFTSSFRAAFGSSPKDYQESQTSFES